MTSLDRSLQRLSVEALKCFAWDEKFLKFVPVQHMREILRQLTVTRVML